MKMFVIEIRKTLVKKVKIRADFAEDAILKVRKRYNNEKIVLDRNDLIKTEISLSNKSSTFDEKKELVNEIIEYLYQDEKKHYEEELNEPNNHIFLKLMRLKDLNNSVIE